MVALWLIGYEDEPDRSGEICVCEIFGRDAAPNPSTTSADIGESSSGRARPAPKISAMGDRHSHAERDQNAGLGFRTVLISPCR